MVSEFYLRQEIPTEILRSCVVLPFNWDDAVQAAKLDFTKLPRDSDSRAAIKDDMKIIAQAMVKDAEWIITGDTRTLCRFARQLRDGGTAKFRTITLEEGFDLSLLDPDGQHEIPFESAEDETQD